MQHDRFGVGLYSPRVAARVARIRYQNFQAWAKAHLLRPSRVKFGTRTETTYSFLDLLLIRLVVRLKEKGFRPNQIRKALDTISYMADNSPHAWLRATIYVDSKLIVATLPGTEDWNPVAASRGPQKMALVFFPELAEELKRELVPERFKHIEIDPEVRAGAPVIKGTRITTRDVVLTKQSGQDPTRMYPELTREEVQDAVDYENFLEVA